jgi:hypothetical protein
MYKLVKIQPYKNVGIDGKTTVTGRYKDNIGVGKFENETIYTLVCIVSKDVGNQKKQESYATLIATLLNENRKYIMDK